MPQLLKSALAAAALLIAPAALPAHAADALGTSSGVTPQFKQGSMNVYRRFPVEDREKMVDFYGKALGLKPLNPINLGRGQQMILFGIGSGQIKLAAGLKEGRQYHAGGATDATGIRVYILRFPDEAAVEARFQAAGFPAPEFRDIGGGRRAALVRDPAGFPLELIVDPKATPDELSGVEVGINVSDLKRSEQFYKGFAGLEPLPPEKDPLLGVTKHPFRHGQTTISLWSVGKDLPHDTGSAGIQYVIGNLDAMNERALTQHVTVEEPLGGVPGFNVRTVWLNDPDGVTNYFYQMGARPQAAAPPATSGGR